MSSCPLSIPRHVDDRRQVSPEHIVMGRWKCEVVCLSHARSLKYIFTPVHWSIKALCRYLWLKYKSIPIPTSYPWSQISLLWYPNTLQFHPTLGHLSRLHTVKHITPSAHYSYMSAYSTRPIWGSSAKIARFRNRYRWSFLNRYMLCMHSSLLNLS